MIWNNPWKLEDINTRFGTHMLKQLGIQFTEITKNSISATMPVNEKSQQPLGLLHGGASVALAESLASTACYLCIDTSKYFAVGLEINANHIRSVKSGFVTARATPIHIGRSTQVWQIEIKNEADKVVCHSRMTMAVREIKA